MKKEPYPKAGAAPSIFMFCVLRGDYSRRVSLMISSNVSPNVEKAKLLLFVNFQRGVHDGVIHAVVNIRCDNRVFAHAGTTHVAFIGEDQRGRDGVYRESGFLIVVTDSRADDSDFFRRHVHAR